MLVSVTVHITTASDIKTARVIMFFFIKINLKGENFKIYEAHSLRPLRSFLLLESESCSIHIHMHYDVCFIN